MLILTIVQNFVKLPHLEGTFLKTSYLSVFGLCRPIIYRPDDIFEMCLHILHLPMELDVWYKFHGHTPSSLGGGTTPPQFTCKPVQGRRSVIQSGAVG